MKRYFSFLIACFLIFISGCSTGRADIPRDEIVAAYEKAGYSVSSGIYDEKPENGQTAYIQATHSSGDSVYFAFFDTEDEAEAYKNNGNHPLVLWFFSTIYGESAWIRTERYGCIVVQYEFPEYLKPFEALREGK